MKTFFIIALCAVFVMVAALAVFFALRRYEEKRLERYQNDLLERHYHEVETMYRQMRGWRHDLKNHLTTMQIHLQNGDMARLKSYLEQLNQELLTVDTVLKTGNVMMDAILNSKLTLAREKQIRLDATARVPKELPFADTDICVVVGNLMDNAIEACAQIPEAERRFIRVYIGMLKGQLYISVTNAVGGALRRSGKTYLSTKSSAHGFGLWRIDRIAEKYGGYVNRQDETDVFATEVLLPLPENKNEPLTHEN